jgi:hypothetical protein
MTTNLEASQTALSRYEAEQVRQIAIWKSLPPNPVDEICRLITLPWARFLERIVPDWIVVRIVDRSYEISRALAGLELANRAAGDFRRGADSDDRSLAECDARAARVATAARTISFVEGAVTGAGGVVTTLVDIPVLFVLSLWTIQKIGRCYGYTPDRARDREYVLAVLITATAGSLGLRRERLDRLHGLKAWLVETTQEEIIADEFVSLLFQLEIFEEIPGVGFISGAVLNFLFCRKVDTTARRVFQERWLRDHGKVTVIEPAPAPHHLIAVGPAAVLTRAARSASYYVAFGVAFPVCLVTSLARAIKNRSLGEHTLPLLLPVGYKTAP